MLHQNLGHIDCAQLKFWNKPKYYIHIEIYFHQSNAQPSVLIKSGVLYAQVGYMKFFKEISSKKKQV